MFDGIVVRARMFDLGIVTARGLEDVEAFEAKVDCV
jgi:hypothetical protein